MLCLVLPTKKVLVYFISVIFKVYVNSKSFICFGQHAEGLERLFFYHYSHPRRFTLNLVTIASGTISDRNIKLFELPWDQKVRENVFFWLNLFW